MNSKIKSEKAEVRQTNGKHSRKGKLACPTCQKVFTYNSQLNEHMLIHKARKFRCPICKKRFTLKRTMTKHLRIHSDEKPFFCTTCSKQFKQMNYLNQHILTMHSEVKPYECPTCLKQFIKKTKRDEHVRIHTGEKPYECRTCQKRFNTNGNLKEHLRIHSEEKLFVCLTCSHHFRYKSNLDEHILNIHLNMRTYICNYCQKGFNRKGLKTHLRTHSGEKPFVCGTCQQVFARKSSLVDHFRLHSGEKPFSCSICKTSFSRRNTMKYHMKKHSNNPKDRISKPKELLQDNEKLMKRFGCWKKNVTIICHKLTDVRELLQDNEELMKRFGCWQKNVTIICHKLTDDEIRQYSSKGYLANIKNEIYDGLEAQHSEDQLADQPKPSTSYQNLPVKEEPNKNADASCINLFEGLFIKEETIFIGNISTVNESITIKTELEI